MINIAIKTSGSAYHPYTDEDVIDGHEVARQLRKLADTLEETYINMDMDGSINDINGNKTLTWNVQI